MDGYTRALAGFHDPLYPAPISPRSISVRKLDPLQSGKGMSVMNLNRLDFHTRLDHTIGNHNLFSELPAPGQMIPAKTEPHGQLYVAFISSLHFKIPILINAKITLECKLTLQTKTQAKSKSEKQLQNLLIWLEKFAMSFQRSECESHR